MKTLRMMPMMKNSEIAEHAASDEHHGHDENGKHMNMMHMIR